MVQVKTHFRHIMRCSVWPGLSEGDAFDSRRQIDVQGMELDVLLECARILAIRKLILGISFRSKPFAGAGHALRSSVTRSLANRLSGE